MHTHCVVFGADHDVCGRPCPQRAIAKHGRDFDTADALRQQLREGGVLVDDGARTYRVVGPSVSAPFPS
eukprot:COSAG01_NODE_8238_length_2860_cov_3.532054_6_plen_69_part_00